MSGNLDDLHGVGENLNEVDRAAGVPELLAELTELVENARAMPMSSSVLINRSDALAIIDDIHEVMPEQIARADSVLSDADAARAEAREQGAEIIARARSQAEQLVARDSLVQQAQERADELVTQARDVAERLRHEADDYCDRRLAELEIDLGRVLQQVQRGRERLAERLTDG